MTRGFNADQLAALERYFAKRGQDPNEKRYRYDVQHELEELVTEGEDRYVRAMDVGRWISNRKAAAEGRPRAQRKTPAQLALLEESFEDDAYPTPLELMRLAALTDLKDQQVKDWFLNTRKKHHDNGTPMWSRSNADTVTDELAQGREDWRDWKKNREEMVEIFKEEEEEGRGEEARARGRRATPRRLEEDGRVSSRWQVGAWVPPS
ncbi:hypothetical protein RQP46_004874 [Phenoliferia psychrophenolica]